MKNNYFIIIVILLFWSCNDSKTGNPVEEKKIVTNDSLLFREDAVLLIEENTEPEEEEEQNWAKTEMFEEKEVLFNGKLKRFFKYRDFEKVFQKSDSIITADKMQPCTTIFDKEQEPQFIYKDSSLFEWSKNKVAVSSFRFVKGNFIQYKNQTLNVFTTKQDISVLFPYASKYIYTVENEGETLEIVELKEGELSDGMVRLYFKNNTLYSLTWWFPC